MFRNEEIAVKVLYNTTTAINNNEEQFKHEFDNLMMLSHENIVRLVAYCYETRRKHHAFEGKQVFFEETYKALCFEYMTNGSLQKHISGTMLIHFEYACLYRVKRNDHLYLQFIKSLLICFNMQMKLEDLTGTHVTTLSRGYVRA